tara:strand:+ start:765 stop:1295 length:531 start_codon:yes stop_codon:yes gene_type:complete
MIKDYFKKYCSYYLSKYSVTKKKFENILKKKISRDFMQKKIDEKQYKNLFKEINDVLEHYKKIGFFDEQNLMDIKLEHFIKRGFSPKKMEYELNKNFFDKNLIATKLKKIVETENIIELLIENYLHKTRLLQQMKRDQKSNKECFDKILKKLLQQGFGQYESINFLKNKFSLDGNF